MIDSINIDEVSSFSIELEINGDVDAMDKPIVRFNIINENYRLVFDAERIDNGIFEVTIPELKNVIKAGNYKCEFDVFLGNKHFVPVKDTIKLTESVAPTVTIRKKKATVNEDITISVKSVDNKGLNIQKLDIISK